MLGEMLRQLFRFTLSRSPNRMMWFVAIRVQQLSLVKLGLTTRCMATLSRRIPYDECSKIIDDLVDEHRPCFDELVQIFRCSEDDMKEFIKRDNTILTSRNLRILDEKVQLLYSYGFTREDLLSNAIWLYFSQFKIRERLDQFKPFFQHKLVTTNVLKMDHHHLQNFIKTLENDVVFLKNYPDRNTCVAAMLGCTVETLMTLGHQGHKHLLTRHVSDLHNVIQVLSGNGIPLDSILKKPNLLKHSLTWVVERMDLAKELNISESKNLIKLALSVAPDIKSRALKYSSEEALRKSAKEYLKHRLNLPESEVDSMFRKHSGLKRIHVHRLKKLLDFLLDDCRFSSTAICQRDVFTHSLEKLKRRYHELTDDSLSTSSEITLLRQMLLPEKKYKELFI